MQCWLTYKNKDLQTRYERYYLIDGKKWSKFYVFIGIMYVVIYSTTGIFNYYYSQTPTVKNTQFILTRVISMTATLFVTLIVAIITKKGSKRYNYFADIIIIIFGTTMVITDDLTSSDLKNVNKEIDYETGYLLYWRGIENQILNIFITFICKNWTAKILYFFGISIFLSFTKMMTPQDIISGNKYVFLSVVYCVIIYWWEKDAREKFLEIDRLMEKDKIWKKILDNLPEEILMIDSNKKFLYFNKSLQNYSLENNIEDFLTQIINIKLREDDKKIELRLRNLLKFYDESSKENSLLEKTCSVKQESTDILSTRFANLFQLISTLFTKNIFQKEGTILKFDGLMNTKGTAITIQAITFEEKNCFIIILTDTSQRDMITKLEQNNKYKNIMLSTVSHELRTPINSSLSMLETALENNDVPLQIKNTLLEPAKKSLSILINMINDLLDYAQIQANKLKLDFTPIDLRRVIKDACILIEIQCEKKGIELIIDIEPRIPNIFTTNPNKLTQIILNLLSNAVKFTKKGFIRLKVDLYEQNDQLIIISVEDTGIGIPSSKIGKLFQDFGKLDDDENRKLNPNGVGLGLSISQKLAQLLGQNDLGGIKVQSTPGVGSKFSFIICDMMKNTLSNDHPTNSDFSSKKIPVPLASSESNIDYLDLSEGAKNCQSVIEYKQQIKKSKLYNTEKYELIPTPETHTRVLVVDDDYFNLYSFEMMVKQTRIQFRGLTSGEEVIDLFKREYLFEEYKPVDIIFMDFNMPNMGGVKTTQVLREYFKTKLLPEIPIIGYTAFINEDIKKEGYDAGMEDIISKPISKKILVRLLKTFNLGEL